MGSKRKSGLYGITHSLALPAALFRNTTIMILIIMGQAVSANQSRYLCDASAHEASVFQFGKCAATAIDACEMSMQAWLEDEFGNDSIWTYQFPSDKNPICNNRRPHTDLPIEFYTCFYDLIFLENGYVNYENNTATFVLDNKQPNVWITSATIKSTCDCPANQVHKRGQCVVPRSGPCAEVGNP